MGIQVAARSGRSGPRPLAVADFPVPVGREEEWRFTPLRRLRRLHEGVPADGKVVVETDAPPEVAVELAGRDDPRLGRAYAPADRVSAYAYEAAPAATVISVPADTVASRPTTVRLRGAGGLAYGHLVVEVGPLAQAVVVLDHQGSATYADNVEFVVGDGASLSVVSLNDWADDTVHLSRHHTVLGRDASVRHFVATLGGDLVRAGSSVRYAGRGGDAELLGLYFADAGQHLEHRLLVDHAVPDCRSRVDYRGALQGEDAHAVWIGDVIIEPEGVGTDTYEHNRNLVLSDGTRVDSVPNLEILTGEVVGAGHASASGRLEDHQIFYLMARGVPERAARLLVIRGFFGALIERIDVPEVRDRVAAAVEAELEQAR